MNPMVYNQLLMFKYGNAENKTFLNINIKNKKSVLISMELLSSARKTKLHTKDSHICSYLSKSYFIIKVNIMYCILPLLKHW